MVIRGKITKEFNRTLESVYVEISDVEVESPFRKSRFDQTQREDERELFNYLKNIHNLKLYGMLPNFKVEVEDIVEFEVMNGIEFVDNWWYFNHHNNLKVYESRSHNARLHKRFVEITGARPVEKW